MPYSKKHNTLFIHIPKCAGKSFEVALGITSKREVNKYKWRSNINRFGKLILKKTLDKKALPRLWGVHDITLAMQHLTYAEIELLNLIDTETLNNSIKVAIVRNPYDRAVSSYHHMGQGYNSFLDFLQNYYAAPSRDHNALAHKRPQIDFLRDKEGNIVVENLIRFENLQEDFKTFKKNYNIKTAEIPHIGQQRKESSYINFYNSETKKLVEEIFNSDFKLLGYKKM
ncbi:sulfotransferase family 2 domain-containing protein [Pseudotamlana carrageenivorans]|uniref:Sulfotransferase n=1 Tax=Pseudotamlana carrageenivorans TaxID=2069432 RepID=A0A2I7SIV8_9FLAO|nr:sulfotransferase family 2 domain-containing protein [Tamlana carrageenivorans]AUS05843.1 hypothetical protein C1A40_10385 [Tamlana carrageenivorans]